MSELEPFNIMAKPVCGVCNLDCCYCYYTRKPKELYPGTTRFLMSDAVLESYVGQYMTAMPVRCEFGWQGGEPTLAGLDFFRKAVELQKANAREGQVVTNAFQTNGTLLDEAWCEFLGANNFLVGISLDGPAQWHDTFRRDHANNRTFHRAWAGLELLRKHGVEFNVLVTLNSANAPHAGDIYRYFVNRGINYVQFIPILERTADDQPTSFSCTADQFGRFMLDVFDIWASRDVGKVSERLIDCVLHTILFGRASTCCYSRRCANAHVLEWNGDLYVCDHFVYPEWRIGNILERPLEELVRDPLLDKFAALKGDLPDKCRACEYLQLCWAGCPKHHRPIGTSADRINHFCEGFKAFLDRALPILLEMAPYIQQGQIPPLPASRNAKPPKSPAAGDSPADDDAAVAPRNAAPGSEASTSAAPGRNDPCPCGSGRKFKNCCGKIA